MRKFPSSKWNRKQLEFWPAPERPPFRPFAAMMFLWKGDEAVIGHIPGRGWSIPSGRLEPGEDGLAAALRETYEEVGVKAINVTYLGCYRISEPRSIRWAEVFVGEVGDWLEIPPESESSDRRLACMSDLPEVYHTWNPLFESLFAYSREVLAR